MTKKQQSYQFRLAAIAAIFAALAVLFLGYYNQTAGMVAGTSVGF